MLWVVILQLLALDGRAFRYLGLSMARVGAEEVVDPVLLDTLTAMTLNGILIYATAWLMERYGTRIMGPAVWLLVVISPFAVLQPVGYLVQVGEYSVNYDWFYLALALAIALLSHHRQRKSFYLAGLLNTGMAIWFITEHNEWFDRPLWAVALILLGLVALGAGFGLDVRRRAKRQVMS